MIETLTDFLLARIAEDEVRAKEAGGEIWDAYYLNGVMTRDDPKWIIDSAKTLVSYEVVNQGFAEHIGQWHPARVLAECGTKRRLVELHRPEKDSSGFWWCSCCGEALRGAVTADACATVRLLSVPYADHPDYRQEWTP